MVMFFSIGVSAKPDSNYTHKNPVTAGVLSGVLPGTGQFYNGQKNKILPFLMGDIFCGAVIYAGYKLQQVPSVTNYTPKGYTPTKNKTIGTILIGSGVVAYAGLCLWGILDAVSSSKDLNTKNEASLKITPIYNNNVAGLQLKINIY